MSSFTLHFVAVGPQRTGSSWLHRVLETHPSLCLPRGVDETMFFDRYYERGLESYAHYFSHRSPGQRCGDISPTYFDSPVATERIRSLYPDCRVMVGLRNPVRRATSLYHHHLTRGRVRGAFREAIEQMPRIVDSGHYAVHVRRWVEAFGRERVFPLLLDDVRTDPNDALARLCHFLGVDPLPPSEFATRPFNETTSPRHPRLARVVASTVTWLHARGLYRVVEHAKSLGLRRIVYEGGSQRLPLPCANDVQALLAEYEPDVAYVETLVGRALDEWRRPPVPRELDHGTPTPGSSKDR